MTSRHVRAGHRPAVYAALLCALGYGCATAVDVRETDDEGGPPARGGLGSGGSVTSGGRSTALGGAPSLGGTGGSNVGQGGKAAGGSGGRGGAAGSSTGGVGAGGAAGAGTGGQTSPGGAAGGAGKGGAAGASGAAGTAGAGGGGSGAGGAGGGSSAVCDWTSAACMSKSCQSACPSGDGGDCVTRCSTLITCVQGAKGCSTAADPLCVQRLPPTSMPNQCTGPWESGQTVPAQVALQFRNCACGAGPVGGGGTGGSAGGAGGGGSGGGAGMSAGTGGGSSGA